MDPEEVPREEFKEWAKRNNYDLVKDEEYETVAVDGAGLEVLLTKYGNVHLTRHRHLGGEDGEISFDEDQLRVADGSGKEHRLSPDESPI
jgi:hypothetical protein